MPASRCITVANRSLASESGEYRLETISNDGVRVFVDGVQVLSSWERNEFEKHDFCVFPLDAGEHAIRVEHFQSSGRGRLGVSLKRTR